MILTFRPIKVRPPGWKGPNEPRLYSPFRSEYRATLRQLDDELRHLDATGVSLQVDARPADVRLDGQLRANATVSHPGCILTIETKSHGTLVYGTDRYAGRWREPGWQANLRAITLGLQALRAVARYGIGETGQQYAGYRELGPGTPMGPAKMTVEAAARFLIEHGETPGCVEPATVEMILDAAGDRAGPGGEVITGYYRRAAQALHPDRGGDPALFGRLSEARALLDTIGGAA